MSKHHTVFIDDAGNVQVDHHTTAAADALQGLADAGGAGQVGASGLDDMRQQNANLGSTGVQAQTGVLPWESVEEPTPQQKRANEVFVQMCHDRNDRQARLNTATKIAQSLVHKGQTHGRDPQYIADKSHAIANALHDKAGDMSHPDYQKILEEVIAQDTPDQEQ